MKKKIPLLLILLLNIFLVLSIIYPFSIAAINLNNNHSIVVNQGSRREKVIALTFDDGPHPRYTNEILDLLKEYDVKATFFVLGKLAEAYPDIIKRQSEEGHEI